MQEIFTKPDLILVGAHLQVLAIVRHAFHIDPDSNILVVDPDETLANI